MGSRFRSALVLAAVAFTSFIGAPAAQAQAPAGGGRGAPAPMTPQVYRQQVMEQLQQSMGALTAIRNGTAGAPSHLVPRATIIQQLSLVAAGAFATNTGADGTRALSAIWDSPADFAARVQELRQAADGLLSAAQAGNADAVAEAQTALQRTCAACHMQFRGPARP